MRNFSQYVMAGDRHNASLSENEMIARTWHATATIENADAYNSHFTTKVIPHLKNIAGHQGAYLLRREVGGRVEFLAITLWDAMESVKKFAGRNPEVAIVEAQAKAVLAEFDDFAKHYQVAYRSPLNP